MQEKQLQCLVLLAIGYILLFAVACPMYSTPHAALVSLSTRNSKDRSLLATISNAAALVSPSLPDGRHAEKCVAALLLPGHVP